MARGGRWPEVLEDMWWQQQEEDLRDINFLLLFRPSGMYAPQDPAGLIAPALPAAEDQALQDGCFREKWPGIRPHQA